MKSGLERRLDRAQVVSLDVFDTAVLRRLDEPRSLFYLMLPRISAVLGARTSEFPATRRFAEFEAHRRARDKESGGEIRLAEIYAVVAEILGLEETAIPELCRLEIEAELAVCCQNPFVYSVYRRSLDLGKQVVFLSDMYLPQEAVGEILNKCGYTKYDALLVSSETRKTKASGGLYKEALARIGVAAEHWLHIGDNLRSDVKVARKLGIPSWHSPSPAQKFEKDRQQFKAWRPDRPLPPAGYVVKGLIANRLTREKPPGDRSKPSESFWEDYGYATTGPVCAGFTEWLVEQVAKRELQAIYFLSRDGYMIQRLFKMFRPPELADLETHYLYASRRALRFATIQTIDEPALEFLTESFDLNEVGGFLQRIGFDPQAYVGDIQRAGFRDARQLVQTSVDFEKLRQLIQSLSEPICERARSERAVILEYLRKSGLADGRRIAVVDVGWRGSQQHSIQEILHAEGERIDISGFYYGTVLPAKNLFGSRLRHEAYLFKLGQPREYEALVMSCPELSELCFTAPEGSLIRLEREQSGDFVPVMQPFDAEEEARHENVEKIQAGAMQFAMDYLALKQEFPDLAIPHEIAINQLRRVLCDPTRD